MMPHAMYFSGNKKTTTKIKQVPYQIINYNDKGTFQVKLMDNTQVQIFIDNGATLSILPLNVYNKYPILQKYPKTENHTLIHTGGGMIEHWWIQGGCRQHVSPPNRIQFFHFRICFH